MERYSKNHDPRKNRELIEQISGKRLEMKQVIQEMEHIFKQCRMNRYSPIPEKVHPLSFSEKIKESLFRLTAKRSQTLEPTRILLDNEGNVIPDWKKKLDQEYNQFLENISKEVNIEDYGAVGDGKTDCTAAFKKAIGNGRVKVLIPPGIFITKGIRLPSWTLLVGSGKGKTTITLHEQASKKTRLITNANHWRGNHHIFVKEMSLNWNVERLGDAAKTSTWGNHSSCLTFANVTYGWVKDVEGMNPGLHCFDISSTQYNYAGDGYRARGGSKYVWLNQVTGYGFGDDGITTHHSDYIFISNSHMCDPSGRAHRKGCSNSNGIEVDDGSRNVVLVNNSSARCFGGVEIKAHQNSSAANNVQIVGHISVNDNRSFNFRHIGHHKITDVESQSAFNIMAVNLAAVAPIFTDLYEDSAPRGMVISAYKNVVVNHFTLVGNPDYDYKGNPLVALQYRARNVSLNNITASNFTNAGAMIKVYGGDNRADSIKIRNCASNKIEISSGVEDITIEKKACANVYF